LSIFASPCDIDAGDVVDGVAGCGGEGDFGAWHAARTMSKAIRRLIQAVLVDPRADPAAQYPDVRRTLRRTFPLQVAAARARDSSAHLTGSIPP
jgi:hypothetical protein